MSHQAELDKLENGKSRGEDKYTIRRDTNGAGSLMNRRKKILWLGILLIIVAASTMGVCLTILLHQLRSRSPLIIASQVRSPKSQYITFNGKDSRIFLISAIPYYGYSNETRKLPTIAEGDPVFIINLTLRNDYSPENPPPGQNALPNYTVAGSVTVDVTAIPFSEGQAVVSRDVSPSNIGMPFSSAEISLVANETGSVQIWISTDRRDIDNFELSLLYVGAIPPP